MHRKLLVSEDTVIHLMAQAAVDQFMIEWLATYLLRTYPPDSQKEWLDDLEKALSAPIGLPSVATEVEAVLFPTPGSKYMSEVDTLWIDCAGICTQTGRRIAEDRDPSRRIGLGTRSGRSPKRKGRLHLYC